VRFDKYEQDWSVKEAVSSIEAQQHSSARLTVRMNHLSDGASMSGVISTWRDERVRASPRPMDAG
jgi:hypothetical protein